MRARHSLATQLQTGLGLGIIICVSGQESTSKKPEAVGATKSHLEASHPARQSVRVEITIHEMRRRRASLWPRGICISNENHRDRAQTDQSPSPIESSQYDESLADLLMLVGQ